MLNIYSIVDKILNEKTLGCKCQPIHRDTESLVSVSFIRLPTIGISYYNDDVHSYEHQVQVDIWADYDTSIEEITNNVIEMMRENGFNLLSVRADMYERDTNIVHRPILFSYIEKIN